MKTLVPGLAACLVALALSACAASSAGSASTEPAAAAAASAPAKITGAAELRGLYTPAQAARGGRRFERLCADCHRTVEITRSWFSGTVHRTAGELYTVMALTMPDSSPGSLAPGDYVEILAYLLQLNDYPSGDEELPSDAAMLADIPIPAP